MSIQGHIVELQRKHHILEEKLHIAKNHAAIDEKELKTLKLKKLKLKDELSKIQTSIH